MFNKDVDPDIAKALMENSNWEKAGFVIDKGEAQAVNESSEEEQSVEGEEELHSCPLCLTELAEPISDEQIVEHLDSVLTIMDVIEESLAKEDPNAEVVEEEEGSDNEEWEWVEEE